MPLDNLLTKLRAQLKAQRSSKRADPVRSDTEMREIIDRLKKINMDIIREDGTK